MGKQVRDAPQVSWSTGGSVLGWGAGLWRQKGPESTQWDVRRAVLLVHLGCWAVGCYGPHCTLPGSSQLPQGPGVQRTLGAGRDPGDRAGCRGAGTRPGMREAQQEGEGRGGLGEGPGAGRPLDAPVMHYWKHLAWAAGAGAGCTRMCTHAHGFGDTRMHIRSYGYVCISRCIHTCIRSCSCEHTYTYVSSDTYTGMEVCTHM